MIRRKTAGAFAVALVAALPFACNANPPAASPESVPTLAIPSTATTPVAPAATDEAAQFGMTGLPSPSDSAVPWTNDASPDDAGALTPPWADASAGGDADARDGGARVILRQGPVEVNGRLPPEVIQRIVRQNFSRFRLCYEVGLRTKPKLAGRVTVRFVIDATGAVSSVADGGSTLGDAATVQCVVRAFSVLSFPAPEAGVATVNFGIIFAVE